MEVTYDLENKKLSSKSLILFPKSEQLNISEVIDVYPQSKNNFYSQLYNDKSNQYEILHFKEADNNDYSFDNHSLIDTSPSIFDLNFPNEENFSNKISIIKSNLIQPYDIEKKEKLSHIILNEVESNPLKISSDIPIAEPEILLCGINSDIFITDLRENKITTKIEKAHSNSILSTHFEMMNKYIICSTGNDYSIKYWDIRKTDECIGCIFNNSHWVWNCKYNKNYPNVLLTSSSSSLVRNIIFNKKAEVPGEEEEIGGGFEKNFNDYWYIDYREFEDSVYAVDWLWNDSMTFAAVSYNSFFHINAIPNDVQYKLMI